VPERLSRLPDASLEAALVDLGGRVQFPPDPNVAPAVYRAITEAVRPAARRGFLERLVPRRPVRRALALALAVAVVVLAGGGAVAGLLGVPGLRIIFSPEASPSAPATLGPVGEHLFLGNRTSLASAEASVRFRVETPSFPGLPAPEVYSSPVPSGGRVTFAYRAGPGLPAARFTHVGLLLTEFQGSVNREFLRKTVTSGTRLRSVTVNGHPGFFISGAPHEVILVNRHGQPFPDTVHLAGNTLVWSHGEVTLRIEGTFGLPKTLAIARSVR
jgi:hypothetical protein